MDTAEIALAVSIASACFTAAGLVLQALLHTLQGPRIEVRLRPMIRAEYGSIYSGPDSGMQGRSTYDQSLRFPFIELAVIRVTNVGRSPISVSEIMLDFGRLKWWRPNSRVLLGGHCLDVVENASDGSSVRLEPGDYVHVAFELWSLVDRAREHLGERVRVRASAQPAGGRAQRSRRRHQWRLGEGQFSIVGSEVLSQLNEPETYMYRGLWQELYHSEDHGVAEIVWRNVADSLSKQGDELGQLLKTRIPFVVEEHPRVLSSIRHMRESASVRFPDSALLQEQATSDVETQDDGSDQE